MRARCSHLSTCFTYTRATRECTHTYAHAHIYNAHCHATCTRTHSRARALAHTHTRARAPMHTNIITDYTQFTANLNRYQSSPSCSTYSHRVSLRQPLPHTVPLQIDIDFPQESIATVRNCCYCMRYLCFHTATVSLRSLPHVGPLRGLYFNILLICVSILCYDPYHTGGMAGVVTHLSVLHQPLVARDVSVALDMEGRGRQ